ncbi:MAG TPA: MBL fold metallo-hydrolase [Candidatus Bipolaricaulota bacterium]|nr:MBL fold metallo-hydrolase [Candidatus Bipolaricaulota bacterium]
MRKNLKKITVSLLAAVLILMGLIIKEELTGFGVNSQASLPAESRLAVYFLDVGQGDASLIITPSAQKILIDGGPDTSVLDKLGANLSFFDRKIDAVVLTHPHADHLNGLIEVVKRYEVGKIYYTGAISNSPAFLEFLQIIKDKEITLEIVDTPRDLDFGDGAILKFIYPFEKKDIDEAGDLNDTSIVNRLVFGRKSFLFMGDAEIPVENKILNYEVDVASDIIKIGHHGSSSSSSEEFLTAVNPQYSVISVGENNSFGHPHLSVVRRLERLGIDIFRTDEDEQISIFSDGDNLEIFSGKSGGKPLQN